jgi:hypothetical protein
MEVFFDTITVICFSCLAILVVVVTVGVITAIVMGMLDAAKEIYRR